MQLLHLLQVSGLFRISLAISLILANGLLLPFIGLTAYELLSSIVGSDPPREKSLFEKNKEVSCAVFHIALSAAVFSMLGSVIERWITINGLDPTYYLEKTNNMVSTGVLSPKKHRRTSRDSDSKPSSTNSFRKPFAAIFLLLSWSASIAFGMLLVLYGKVRFLLFGEFLNVNDRSKLFQFASLLQIPHENMIVVSVFYVAFLFVPLLLLILSSAITLCCLLKIQSNAKKIESYGEAKVRSASSQKPTDVPLNHKLLQITRSTSRSERDLEGRRPSTRTNGTNDRRSSSRTERDERNSTSIAEYSHKMEHERQVTLNCQETALNGIQTDSIQVCSDPVPESSQATNAPLPPEWLKFSSLTRVRYSDNSAIQVVDLASSSVSVSIDSARCYFGETNETRSILIAFSTMSLFLLPLCALIAIDVFAGKNSIFQGQSYENIRAANEFFSTDIASSLGAGFVALYLLGGWLPFFLFYGTSDLFKKGAQRICCSKDIKGENEILHRQNSSYSNFAPGSSQRNSKRLRNGSTEETRNGKPSQHPRWSAKRIRSLDVEGWRPEERRPCDSMHENNLDIDERFELDNDDE